MLFFFTKISLTWRIRTYNTTAAFKSSQHQLKAKSPRHSTSLHFPQNFKLPLTFLQASTSQPCAIKRRTIARWPFWAAKKSAEAPSLRRAAKSAGPPCARSRSTAATWPFWQATRKGQPPSHEACDTGALKRSRRSTSSTKPPWQAKKRGLVPVYSWKRTERSQKQTRQ